METSPAPVFNHLSSCEACKCDFLCNNFAITESGQNDYAIMVKKACILNLRNQQLIDNILHRAPHSC